jgi:hypothetical protein
MEKNMTIRTVTGWVDSTDLYHEFGETPGALKVFATEEELVANTHCIGTGEHDCRAVRITYEVGEQK